MFSQRPILVYGHPASGLVTYAKTERWAHVVDQRNVDMLEEALREIIFNVSHQQNLVSTATMIVMRNNDCNYIRKVFLDGINAPLKK
jgi:acyl-CoA thioesterase FadM